MIHKLMAMKMSIVVGRQMFNDRGENITTALLHPSTQILNSKATNRAQSTNNSRQTLLLFLQSARSAVDLRLMRLSKNFYARNIQINLLTKSTRQTY
jgi:hypothetical protein